MGRGLLAGRVTHKLSAQQSWTAWLRESLPPELAGHVVHAVPRQGELVVFADTPAWCARLRYAVAGIEQSIKQRDSSMLRTYVRVQPS
jgi:Dna[CI] antecedent, DciA